MKYWIPLVFISGVAFAQEASLSEQKIEANTTEGAIQYGSTVDIYAEVQYGSNLQLREERKVGIGTQIGGGLGVWGMNLEVNINSQYSALAGMGTGPGYGTFQMLGKYHWEGKYFTPYVSAGISRWYNSGNTSDHEKSLILDRVLNKEEKDNARFGVDFLVASYGMQYLELGGQMAGTSFFAEFGFMSASRNLTPLLTGSLGAAYYF